MIDQAFVHKALLKAVEKKYGSVQRITVFMRASTDVTDFLKSKRAAEQKTAKANLVFRLC